MDPEFTELLEAHRAAYCRPLGHDHAEPLAVVRCALAILAEGEGAGAS